MSFSRNNHLNWVFIFSLLALFSGCRDREEAVIAPCSTLKADEALKKAEALIEAAGISLSFDEPGELTEPEKFLPDPASLGDPETQKNIEAAIEQLNIVLSELEQLDPFGSECPASDRALIHLHLGILYVLDAISRLQISDDPGETFIIKLKTGSSEPFYDINVTQPVKSTLDATKNPNDYPLAFTAKERLEIINTADLIDDAVVKPIDPNIQPQFSSVNRPPYSKYAIWHFQRAVSLFGQYDHKVEEAMEDFNKRFDSLREELQIKSESWGFKYTLPPGR